MRIKPDIYLTALLLCSGASAALAKSGNSLPILKDVKSIDVELTFGGGLDVQPGVAFQLFGGNFERTSAFELSIKRAVLEGLATAGVQARITTPSEGPAHDFDGWLAIGFFGRPIAIDDDCLGYVFLVSLDAGRYNTSSDLCEAEPHELRWSRKVIGVSAGRELEVDLETTLMSLLEELASEEASDANPKIESEGDH